MHVNDSYHIYMYIHTFQTFAASYYTLSEQTVVAASAACYSCLIIPQPCLIPGWNTSGV